MYELHSDFYNGRLHINEIADIILEECYGNFRAAARLYRN